MTPRTYSSPEAFKQALEQRLRTAAKTGAGLARKRQLVVFDRLLARIVAVLGDAVTLKGGLVLELRIARARATKDIDLRLMGAPDDVLAKLQEAARVDLGDFMTFEVGPDDDHPDIQNDGILYDGRRFRAECRLAGKLYGQRFGVDVAFGDPILGDPDIAVAEDVLGFAGIAPPTLRIYPIETHIAEKLHAYTMPRTRPNSRVKDLPDLALLATTRSVDAKRLRAALDQTFGFRRTHDLPTALPEPASTWAAPYAAMARDDQLAWQILADVTAAARAFLDPVLASELDAEWNPEAWSWRRRDDDHLNSPFPATICSLHTPRRKESQNCCQGLLNRPPSSSDLAACSPDAMATFGAGRDTCSRSTALHDERATSQADSPRGAQGVGPNYGHALSKTTKLSFSRNDDNFVTRKRLRR